MLDYFRVPYQEVDIPISDGVEELAVAGGRRAVMWKRATGTAPIAAVIAGDDDGIPIFAEILADEGVEEILERHGGTWHQAREITGPAGAHLGSVWRAADGSVFLPFDPNEVIESFWSERYLRTGPGSRMRGARRFMMRAYYRTRPLLPRPLQIWLRRRFARLQARAEFPRWPVETCLHDFFELMFAILSDLAEAPIPYIAPWPQDYDWTLVLTHDVEHAEGLAAMEPVLELERSHGMRSSWNVVPQRYEIDLARVIALTEQGHEVGVHGLYHDGRDLESLATWQTRLPKAHEAAALWGAVGFRSAALHRNAQWLRMLGCDYDSSYPDTDPYEPQDGGCCTWLPFFNGEMVELPVTLPQDHTLFVILGQEDAAMWIQKAEFLRRQGGLAVIDTHPDYLGEERILRAYAAFLNHFSADTSVWRALPREVSAWWRRRAASSLYFDGGCWRITGPAAGEGCVAHAGGTW